MDYSSDWLLSLVDQYEKERGKNYVFLSDWNISSQDIKYPKRIINIAADEAKNTSSPYSFAEDQTDKKELIIRFLETLNIYLSKERIAIVGSATAGLYASILSLLKKGVSRFLLATPAYYTILDTLKPGKWYLYVESKRHLPTIVLRRAQKISQAQLAFEAGVRREAITHIERGDQNATTDTLHSIAGALGVHIREMFDFEY